MSLSGHDDVAFLNDVANDAKLTQKSILRSKIACLKSESMGILIKSSIF